MRAVSWTGMFLTALVGLGGCMASGEENLGRIDLALAGQTPSGTTYRLRHAAIRVEGVGTSFTFLSEDDPDRVTLQKTVTAGHYALTLENGWQLERVGTGGQAVPVVAALTSANPQSVDVADGGSTVVHLRFRVGGSQVETGQGDLGVVVDIDEPDAGTPDATPLPSCDQPLPCPAGATGTASICGRIFDTETGARVTPVSVDQYAVKVRDPLAFRADPTTPPLAVGQADACGRFAFVNVPVPPTGLASVSVTDGSAPVEPIVATAVGVAVSAGAVVANVRAFSTRASTEQAWDVSAGLPATSILQSGAYLAVYLNAATGMPIPGVVVSAAGSPSPSSDFYFVDSNPTLRSTVDPLLAATGANGAALFVNAQLTQYSGISSSGCSFPGLVGGSSPGIVVVQLFPGTCP